MKLNYVIEAEAKYLNAKRLRRQQEQRARAQGRPLPPSPTHELISDLNEEKALGIEVKYLPIDEAPEPTETSGE